MSGTQTRAAGGLLESVRQRGVGRGSCRAGKTGIGGEANDRPDLLAGPSFFQDSIHLPAPTRAGLHTWQMDHPSAPGPITNFQHPQDATFSAPAQLARGRQARDPQAKTVTYNVASLEEFETSLREYLSNPPDQPEHTECQLCFWIGTSFLVAAPKPSAAQPTPPSQQQPQQQPPPPPAPPRFAQHPDASAGFQSAAALQQYAPPTSPYQSVPDPALALTLATFPPQASPPTAASNGAGGSANTTRKPEQKTSMSILEALQPTQDPKEKMQKQRSIAKCCIDAIQRVDGFRYSFHNCWNSV